MTVTELPRKDVTGEAASGSRWQPSRAGIVNVWRYYDETFEFHNGRLLLRGPNGTGKSKALELLLPFLLDASLRAHRLSTFGGSERSMHWNLMGEGASGVTRVGYVWLEFTARDDDGRRRWFCCGARLQASTRTTTVHADYFTTSRRIGVPGGLALVNDSGQPLTKAALGEEIGEHGQVHPTAAEYRAAVRGTLFPGLSEQRYEALITALLQLRTPKLSERLDPELLSRLLSRALPPLGQAEITELAEGFERLDRQRERLARLDTEVAAAETLDTKQRTYAQRVLRAAAADLVSATSEMDRLTRTARDSEQLYQEAVVEQSRAEQHKRETEERTDHLQARIEGLTDSEAYKQGRELDQLRDHAAEARRHATESRTSAEGKRRDATEDTARAEEVEQSAEAAATTLRSAEMDARRAAEHAGMTSTHHEVARAVEADRQTRQLLRAAVRSRDEQIRAVRAVLDRHDAALRDRDAAERDLEQARTELARANEHRAEAARTHETALDDHARSLRDWAAGNEELRVEDPDDLAALAGSRSAVLDHVSTAHQRVADAITSRATTLSRQRDELREQRERLTAEIERLRHEAELPPDAPSTRTSDRTTMPGAPLWKLVAFAEDVPSRDRAGVESALQAAGLLDAWLAPDGNLAVTGHDTFVEPDLATPAGDRSLLDVLRPEPDQPVPVQRVEEVLRGIAYGETLPGGHAAAIGADGRWRLAGATGSWSKDEVAHIGAAARERARLRRVDELTEQNRQLDARVAEFDSALDELRRRREHLDAEREALPDDRSLETARRELDRAETTVGVRDDAVSHGTARVTSCERAVEQVLRQLTTSAAEHALPAERTALDQLGDAVTAFSDLGESWLDAAIEWGNASRAASTARRAAERTRAVAEEQEGAADRAEEKARRLADRLQAVESTIDADYQQVLTEIGELREQLRQARTTAESLDGRLRELAGRVGELGYQRRADSEHRDSAVAARDSAAQRFRRLGTTSLPDDAGIDLGLSGSEGSRAALEAARSVAATWPNTPHTAKNLTDALARLSETVHTCRQQLAERADLSLEPEEDVQIFVAVVDGVRVGSVRMLETLRADRDRSREDITAAERELFDKTLTGDTRRHLADRIRQANELVDAMNSRLQRVRTASNVAVQLLWQVDPSLPAGTKEARELLLKDPARLSEDDRESLHRFFRERIEEAKEDDTATSWEAQLAQVFDYTAWHRFVVRVDRGGGGGWQLLTKKLHGALSGGEKAIALHLPLFAAVAAHYQSVLRAPRMILLDEVFVGVDTTNRGQVFELLASLDLDLVLTSDHEWCTYRELDGIAIHQLITGDDDDAVTTARFVWDGTGWLPEEAEETA